jgi:hypothetical protein
MAEYRSGHSLAGCQLLMQNAELTDAQDPGAVTELLSGAFYEPFGRSTSHQLWSSAMVITPLLRGLFGIDVDALRHRVTVTPHLPATWNGADVSRVFVGQSVVNLHYGRVGGAMQVNLEVVSGPPVSLQNGKQSVSIPLPEVEVAMPHALPPRGSRTAEIKVLNENHQNRSFTLEVEAPGGSQWVLDVRLNGPPRKLTVDGAEVVEGQLHVHFPTATGYTTKRITLSW